jgi:hypothetical protein
MDDSESDDAPVNTPCPACSCQFDVRSKADASRQKILFCFQQSALPDQDRTQLLAMCGPDIPIRFFQRDSHAAGGGPVFSCYVPAHDAKQVTEQTLSWLQHGERNGRGGTCGPTAKQRKAMRRLFACHCKQAAAARAEEQASAVKGGDARDTSMSTAGPSDTIQATLPEHSTGLDVDSQLDLDTFLAQLLDATTAAAHNLA